LQLLIDTSILIDHLRAKPEATAFLKRTRAQHGLTTNSAVVAEVLSGARNQREQNEIDRLVAAFRVIPIEPVDSDLSLSFLRQLRLSQGIGWHDCLIAATAIRLNLSVATLNDRHFSSIPGLQVHRPY
jgi:predicted nucleic acid-binding protein